MTAETKTGKVHLGIHKLWTKQYLVKSQELLQSTWYGIARFTSYRKFFYEWKEIWSRYICVKTKFVT